MTIHLSGSVRYRGGGFRCRGGWIRDQSRNKILFWWWEETTRKSRRTWTPNSERTKGERHILLSRGVEVKFEFWRGSRNRGWKVWWWRLKPSPLYRAEPRCLVAIRTGMYRVRLDIGTSWPRDEIDQVWTDLGRLDLKLVAWEQSGRYGAVCYRVSLGKKARKTLAPIYDQ